MALGYCRSRSKANKLAQDLKVEFNLELAVSE